MTDPVLVQWRRGDFVERAHRGRVAIVDGAGEIVFAAGDVETPFLPRSSCKILQALPMVESGAADAFGLRPQLLAMACASHSGSRAHALLADAWLAEMGLSEADLECGPQAPGDAETREALRAAGEAPSQLHNNCSGKHTGFLTQALHLGASTAGYVDPGHAVQRRVEEATAEMAGEAPAGHATDGCSAPNFAISPAGLARAMARVAAAETALSGARRAAAIRLREAMATHPFEIAGEGRSCTDLVRAGGGRLVVKTGAEGACTAILPERGLGIALKIDDGGHEASNAAMAAILVALGALDEADPRVAKWLKPEVRNRRDILCGGASATEILTGLTLN